MAKPRVYVESTIPSLGLFVPALVTPLELLGGSDETDEG